MKINSITTKLGGSIMILFLVVLFPLMYTIDQLFTAFYVNQQKDQIKHFAAEYSTYISDVADVHSYHMFDMLSELMDADFFVFNKEGQILQSTVGSSFEKGTNVHDDLFQSIRNNQSAGMEYKADRESFFLAGHPIIVEDQVNGGLVVVSNMEEVNRSIEQVRFWLFISVVGALFIAIGFTFFVSRKLSSPLLQMEKATREIAKGNLKTNLEMAAKDEVGSLAAAITDLGRELEEYRTNRREFFANISHELRTPISYIKGYSKVLRDGLVQNEEEKNQYLRIIEEESARLTALINDLFELAKMEEGKLELHFEWLDVEDILNSAVKKVSLKASEKKIDVLLRPSADDPLLYTDGVRLEQILMNLIENAIRYSEPESTVEMYTKVEKHYIHLFIQDFGMGIPDEDAPYIFDRFYRVEKSRSRASGGTGLGLAIVKNLVELLGGDIELKSTSDKGTIFKLSFPIDKKGSVDG
ncbi:hypothetical protein BTO30_09045 [Domibacillus antri]|uniref:histidine kinase n=1 Tax=Domibacillus antri TaxID=1714264 RepID=A0A1Q8Q521_9BACI|nr:HAMP domain-containing sensor histidine kinase [Domibacillus antri]OLN22450.1 hypothetical protein BTO30_09045 [Domibacillus antri]